MKLFLLCAVLVFGMAGPAGAAFMTGNQLLANCQNVSFEKGLCFGYVEGIVDVFSGKSTVNGLRACVPKNAKAQQPVDVVVAWLEAHPAGRRWPASNIVALALSKAYPCR